MSSQEAPVAGSPANIRYHGLDALRAWAMSMGIVLHAAWIMIPGEAGAPATDASASSATEFICLGIHTFRMQLFFVLAGLFACLLMRKRGLSRFLINRTQRILMPLIVFWLILCPIMMWQYNAAGIASGAIQGDQSALDLTIEYFANLTPGSVLMMHLWFLYYLCWIYVAFLPARWALSLLDRRRSMRDWVADRFGALVCRPWAFVVLAALFAPLMMPMKGVWGVEVSLDSLFPEWPGLVTYIAYFAVGWLVFHNIDKLQAMVRGWRWQLALGTLLIAPYFFYAQYASRHGYATWQYPMLTVTDFRFEDGKPAYGAFRDKMIESDPSSIAGTLWQALPEANRQFVSQHASASENQLQGLLMAINTKVLGDADFTERIDASGATLSASSHAAVQLPAEERTIEQTQQLNRELLNAEFSGILYTEDIHRPYYYQQRAVYCFAYSLITWSLIFGCLGFSQRFFDGESRFWRYFSDSSYWFYLAHLPIQFQLLLWMGDQTWPWFVKFTAYIVITIAILLPSYHLLVRPTRIGWFLNGRMASVWPYPRSVAKSTSPSFDTVRIDAATSQPLRAGESPGEKVKEASSSSLS